MIESGSKSVKVTPEKRKGCAGVTLWEKIERAGAQDKKKVTPEKQKSFAGVTFPGTKEKGTGTKGKESERERNKAR